MWPFLENVWGEGDAEPRGLSPSERGLSSDMCYTDVLRTAVVSAQASGHPLLVATPPTTSPSLQLCLSISSLLGLGLGG